MKNTKSDTIVSDQGQFFDSTFRFLIILFGIFILIICSFPIIFTAPASCSRLDFTETGQIGDTFGGIIGPFIAIGAALLTFIAFWVQFKANQQQTKQFEKQAEDVTIERIENKYYELLRIQRDNLNEIEIGYYANPEDSVKGRRAFISMFLELRFCYSMTKKFIENYNLNELGFKPDDESTILDIAYHIFFMGIGDNSDKLVLNSLSGKCDQKFLIDLIVYLEREVKKQYRAKSDRIFHVKLKDNPNTLEYSSKYLPLSGHISRLGHYFRHLFQTVKFISKQDEKTLDEDKKCEYAKTLRAQLSDYEQLILFYNIISNLGVAWVAGENSYIKRFRMIKNMPLPLADFAVVPKTRFATEIDYWNKKGKSFFEWDEREFR